MAERLFFIPRSIPSGETPEELREKWLGVPLPIERISSPGPGSLVGASDRSSDFVVNEGERTAEVKTGLAVMCLRAFGLEETADFWYQVANDGAKEYKKHGFNMDPQNYPLHFLIQKIDELLLRPELLTKFADLGQNSFGVAYVGNFPS